jgi:hypothetical protein
LEVAAGEQENAFLTTLADQIAVKKHFQHSIAMSWLRKIAFTLLRAQVLCVRGSHTWKKTPIPIASDIELSERNSKL